ncbi:MAG TPA: YihY/virulence factor BrkB family protein [Myxococcaceae bacterium]|nr:YihY/virulence factor BrkB family protein [Myxococcaceae bacterium]
MPGALGEVTTLVKETVTRWTEDKASTLAAALAYYALFSLAPLVLIAVAVAGLVFGRQAAEGQLYTQLAGLIGDSGGKAVQELVANLHRQQGGGVVATAVGLATLFFGASGVFAQLQESMNTIWKASPPTTNGIVDFFRVRLLSFSMVLGVGFLLLVSLVLSAVLAAVGDYLGTFLPGGAAVGQALNATVSLVVITALFAMIYRMLPDTYVAWRDVWLGALVTSLLFTIGKSAIGFYLGKASVASSYGAAGSVVILLLWVYYSAMILYLGAEFTQVYSMRHGSRRAATHAPVPDRREGRDLERLIPPGGAAAKS